MVTLRVYSYMMRLYTNHRFHGDKLQFSGIRVTLICIKKPLNSVEILIEDFSIALKYMSNNNEKGDIKI